MVLKHFQDKAAAAAKAEKEEEQRLRKVASFVAKEIRTFWTNVEKVYGSFYCIPYIFLICSWFHVVGGVQATDPIRGKAKASLGSTS